jgi:hypothetical protein
MFYNWPCNSIFGYAMDIYNSLYLFVYTMQIIATQLQLHNNYTHDVMLTSLIVIHPLKSNTLHYEFFWTYIHTHTHTHIYFLNSNIDLHCPLLLMMVQNCDTCHNKKFARGILIDFEKIIIIYFNS